MAASTTNAGENMFSLHLMRVTSVWLFLTTIIVLSSAAVVPEEVMTNVSNLPEQRDVEEIDINSVRRIALNEAKDQLKASIACGHRQAKVNKYLREQLAEASNELGIVKEELAYELSARKELEKAVSDRITRVEQLKGEREKQAFTIGQLRREVVELKRSILEGERENEEHFI